MTKKIKWRLSSLPDPSELRELVKDKIITQEEAREILFSNEEVEDRDKKSLESEIKFLREVIENLSQKRVEKVVEIIKEIKVPYQQLWYKPYEVWCSNSGGLYNSTSGVTASFTNCGFSQIKTF